MRKGVREQDYGYGYRGGLAVESGGKDQRWRDREFETVHGCDRDGEEGEVVADGDQGVKGSG